MKKLARELVSRLPELTAQRNNNLAFSNAELNQPFIKQTIFDLPEQPLEQKDESALVIGAGPSIQRRDSISRIVESGYKGTIVCADGALGHCLRGSLVPDYVVTVDPHLTRIVRWFGDPEFSSPVSDDMFRRQDLDRHLGVNEVAANQEMVELVNHYGPKMKVIIATSASQKVTQRCIEAGIDMYWWNPLFDDFDEPGSLTRRIFNLNKVPCMVSGGNVGTSAWVFAQAVLLKMEVGLVGMDFGYAPETPPEQSQYYPEIVELFGERAKDAYIDVYNSHLKETWYTDPAYYWYRQSFLDMARKADCTTFNCTEGGILFGRGIRLTGLQEFTGRRNAAVGQ